VTSPQGQFGKYQLIERIATGGMAEIYRARYQAAAGVTKPVVIKKILPHFAGDRQFISMFINEAKIAVGLAHGNIAQVFDFGEIDGEYFLAMEFVDGQPLNKVLRKARAIGITPLPVPFAVFVAMEICKGLHYAHNQLDEAGDPMHIIHRDVSPQNILLSYEGQVKLVDFGIARARIAEREATTAGAKGKYIYFSPEQARGKPLDARTDLFATGIVLYEMTCGKLPFEGKMMDALTKIVRGQFVPPRQFNPNYPEALEKIVLKAMANEPAARYPDAQALHDALSNFLYSWDPTFTSSALARLMSHLYAVELDGEGSAPEPSSDFLTQLEAWRKPHRSIPTDLPSELHPEMPALLEHTAHLPPEALLGKKPLLRKIRTPPRWMLLVAPLSAALLSFAAVVGMGQFAAASIRLTSFPPGAEVRVDGEAAPSFTPLLISNLAPEEEHLIEVRLPGMKPWSRKLKPVRGKTLPIHAQLEPDGEAATR
jgi:serine/threonine protein kinase